MPAGTTWLLNGSLFLLSAGHSGATAVDRSGFQRLVAEVSLGRVGLVMGLSVSRLARNNADWHRVLEICALTGTLIVDEDGIYDPNHFNDRLILGLKGSLNEYELDLLRQRSQEARRQKAARGGLVVAAPVGYIKPPDQRQEKVPDLRVQEAIELLFSKFFELRTARQTMMWFLEQGLNIPGIHQTEGGPETVWRRP